MITRNACGLKLEPAVNVDRVNVAAGLTQALQFGTRAAVMPDHPACETTTRENQ
jgi:hypothetical protein